MLEVITIPVTEFYQNCRVLRRRGESGALVIDPGGDIERIRSVLQKHGLRAEEIWLTHSHLDHCGAVRALKQESAALLSAHPGEGEMRKHVPDIAAFYGITSGLESCPEPDRALNGGEQLAFGGCSFQVLFTPGHSPGHLCFYEPSEGILLAGDTLFAGSIGRTDLPGGDSATLLRSIREKILTLPDATRVLSGHGPDTTVGAERRSNPFLNGA